MSCYVKLRQNVLRRNGCVKLSLFRARSGPLKLTLIILTELPFLTAGIHTGSTFVISVGNYFSMQGYLNHVAYTQSYA